MLQIRDLYYSIGELQLLSGINWVIQPGKRAALIGPNGAGKTTLLRILTGEIKHLSGNIIKPKTFRIGYLPQEEIAIAHGSILQTVCEGQPEIIALEKKISELHNALNASDANQDNLLKQLGTLEQRYEALEGYRLETSAKIILSGLGFAATDFSHPLTEFSGGWRMRAYLARLLVQQPDLLLLDEPTNHLDLPSLEWLEQYLLSFSGSIIIVSHDRFFIDRLAHEIYELDRGKLEHYAGNYHFYEQQKEQKRIQLLKKLEEQKAERERQTRFINRFRYKATKAVQVQSRIKQLEKMEQIELPPPPRRLNFNLSVEKQSYKHVLNIENMSFRYDDDWVLQDVNLNLYRGEKICLVGVNGAGKTTLTKLITEQVLPQQGSIVVGNRTNIGYYAQHQVDALNLEATVYDEVESTVANSLIPRVRDALGIFQLSGDEIFKKIKVLSGGEKARVSLSKILLSPVNFLIMDEPTNHLDMASREALEYALSQYDGTLLLISHDRYFLDKLVSRVIEIKDGQLKEYLGNYSEYLERREVEQKVFAKPKDKPKTISTAKKTKEQKRQEAEARQAISKKRNRLKNEIESLELKIEKLETRKKEVEAQLTRPETYKNEALAVSLPGEFGSIKEDLQNCYERWEEAQLELEEIMSRIF